MNRSPNSLMVSVIIVNYNTSQHVAKAVEHLRASEDSFEIIVADNSCSKKELDSLRAIPDIVIIEAPFNGGFGYGCNLGAAAAHGDYLVFHNPDVTVKPTTVNRLVQQLVNNPNWGVVGGQMRFDDGRIQLSAHKQFPTMLSHFYEYLPTLGIFGPHIPYLRDRLYSPTLIPILELNHDQPVAHLLGALVALRRDLFEKSGGFDEGFFLYREETDLMKRISDLGYQNRFDHQATAIHSSGASTGNALFASLDSRYAVSVYRYLRKHHGLAYVAASWFIATIGLILSLPVAMAAYLTAFSLRKNHIVFRVATKKILLCLGWHATKLPSILLPLKAK